jgi:hypothetical protein
MFNSDRKIKQINDQAFYFLLFLFLRIGLPGSVHSELFLFDGLIDRSFFTGANNSVILIYCCEQAYCILSSRTSYDEGETVSCSEDSCGPEL